MVAESGQVSGVESPANILGVRVSSHCDSAEVASNPAVRLGKGGEPEEVGGYRLQSQDSLGITRARLARQRENARMALLNQINSMQARTIRSRPNPCVRIWQWAEWELPTCWWCGQPANVLLRGAAVGTSYLVRSTQGALV